MKFFTKQQIEDALKAHYLCKTLGYPSNADFEAVLQVGGIGGCTFTVDDAKLPTRFGELLSLDYKAVLYKRLVNASHKIC